MKIACCLVFLALCGAVSLGSSQDRICPKQMYCFFDGLARTITCKFTKPSPALFNPRWKLNGTDIQSCCSNCVNFTRLNGTHYVTLLNYSSFSPGVYKIALEHYLVGPIKTLCADIVPRYTATVVVTEPQCRENIGEIASSASTLHINRKFKNILARLRIEQKVDLELEDTSQSG